MAYYERDGSFLWIDRARHWVGIQRGSVGTVGESAIIAAHDEEAARRRMEHEVASGGFVIAEALQQPRLVFVAGDQFASLQLRGALLLEAAGLLAELETASAKPTFA